MLNCSKIWPKIPKLHSLISNTTSKRPLHWFNYIIVRLIQLHYCTSIQLHYSPSPISFSSPNYENMLWLATSSSSSSLMCMFERHSFTFLITFLSMYKLLKYFTHTIFSCNINLQNSKQVVRLPQFGSIVLPSIGIPLPPKSHIIG
jgi:hypothetical protein